MTTFLRIAGAVVGLAVLCGTASGQVDLIGSRGSQTAPSIPPATTVPTPPVLPDTLNLPPEATSSLLKGLNASGTALRPGMGWLVRDLTHQGIHGRQLADIIHQLKPYKQRGVLTFPQDTPQSGTPFPGTGFQQPKEVRDHGGGHGHGHAKPASGRGAGKGGKGKGK